MLNKPLTPTFLHKAVSIQELVLLTIYYYLTIFLLIIILGARLKKRIYQPFFKVSMVKSNKSFSFPAIISITRWQGTLLQRKFFSTHTPYRFRGIITLFTIIVCFDLHAWGRWRCPDTIVNPMTSVRGLVKPEASLLAGPLLSEGLEELPWKINVWNFWQIVCKIFVLYCLNLLTQNR